MIPQKCYEWNYDGQGTEDFIVNKITIYWDIPNGIVITQKCAVRYYDLQGCENILLDKITI